MHKKFLGLSFWLILFLLCSALPLKAEKQQIPESLSLEQAFNLALDNNQQIISSREVLIQADKDVAITASGWLPQVNLQAQTVRQKETLTTPSQYNSFTVSGSQHIFQAGKMFFSIKESSLYRKSIAKQHYKKIQEVLFQVAHYYYQVLLAQRSEEIAKNQLIRAKRHLDQAEQRYEVGLINHTAVLRAEVQVGEAEEQLERARNQKSIALEKLGMEIGIDEPLTDVQDRPELSPEQVPVAKYYQKALFHRRDLQQMELIIEAMQKRIKKEKADYWPKLSVEGSHTVTEQKNVFYGDDETWEVAIKASLPLSTGWRDTMEINKARAQYREQQAEYKYLKRSIRTEVRSVYLDIQTQKKVIQSILDQKNSAKANYEETVAEFQEGLASSVDVVDALTLLDEVENRLASAYYNRQLNILRLKLATGTFKNDLVQQHIQNYKPVQDWPVNLLP